MSSTTRTLRLLVHRAHVCGVLAGNNIGVVVYSLHQMQLLNLYSAPLLRAIVHATADASARSCANVLHALCCETRDTFDPHIALDSVVQRALYQVQVNLLEIVDDLSAHDSILAMEALVRLGPYDRQACVHERLFRELRDRCVALVRDVSTPADMIAFARIAMEMNQQELSQRNGEYACHMRRSDSYSPARGVSCMHTSLPPSPTRGNYAATPWRGSGLPVSYATTMSRWSSEVLAVIASLLESRLHRFSKQDRISLVDALTLRVAPPVQITVERESKKSSDNHPCDTYLHTCTMNDSDAYAGTHPNGRHAQVIGYAEGNKSSNLVKQSGDGALLPRCAVYHDNHSHKTVANTAPQTHLLQRRLSFDHAASPTAPFHAIRERFLYPPCRLLAQRILTSVECDVSALSPSQCTAWLLRMVQLQLYATHTLYPLLLSTLAQASVQTAMSLSQLSSSTCVLAAVLNTEKAEEDLCDSSGGSTSSSNNRGSFATSELESAVKGCGSAARAQSRSMSKDGQHFARSYRCVLHPSVPQCRSLPSSSSSASHTLTESVPLSSALLSTTLSLYVALFTALVDRLEQTVTVGVRKATAKAPGLSGGDVSAIAQSLMPVLLTLPESTLAQVYQKPGALAAKSDKARQSTASLHEFDSGGTRAENIHINSGSVDAHVAKSTRAMQSACVGRAYAEDDMLDSSTSTNIVAGRRRMNTFMLQCSQSTLMRAFGRTLRRGCTLSLQHTEGLLVRQVVTLVLIALHWRVFHHTIPVTRGRSCRSTTAPPPSGQQESSNHPCSKHCNTLTATDTAEDGVQRGAGVWAQNNLCARTENQTHPFTVVYEAIQSIIPRSRMIDMVQMLNALMCSMLDDKAECDKEFGVQHASSANSLLNESHRGHFGELDTITAREDRRIVHELHWQLCTRLGSAVQNTPRMKHELTQLPTSFLVRYLTSLFQLGVRVRSVYYPALAVLATRTLTGVELLALLRVSARRRLHARQVIDAARPGLHEVVSTLNAKQKVLLLYYWSRILAWGPVDRCFASSSSASAAGKQDIASVTKNRALACNNVSTTAATHAVSRTEQTQSSGMTPAIKCLSAQLRAHAAVQYREDLLGLSYEEVAGLSNVVKVNLLVALVELGHYASAGVDWVLRACLSRTCNGSSRNSSSSRQTQEPGEVRKQQQPCEAREVAGETDCSSTRMDVFCTASCVHSNRASRGSPVALDSVYCVDHVMQEVHSPTALAELVTAVAHISRTPRKASGKQYIIKQRDITTQHDSSIAEVSVTRAMQYSENAAVGVIRECRQDGEGATHLSHSTKEAGLCLRANNADRGDWAATWLACALHYWLRQVHSTKSLFMDVATLCAHWPTVLWSTSECTVCSMREEISTTSTVAADAGSEECVSETGKSATASLVTLKFAELRAQLALLVSARLRDMAMSPQLQVNTFLFSQLAAGMYLDGLSTLSTKETTRLVSHLAVEAMGPMLGCARQVADAVMVAVHLAPEFPEHAVRIARFVERHFDVLGVHDVVRVYCDVTCGLLLSSTSMMRHPCHDTPLRCLLPCSQKHEIQLSAPVRTCLTDLHTLARKRCAQCLDAATQLGTQKAHSTPVRIEDMMSPPSLFLSPVEMDIVSRLGGVDM